MKVLFLGTGNAFAAGGRRAMAILLRAGGKGVLLDCGPTTLFALKERGLSPEDVDLVLLSHHHGDHFAGVPFLVLHEHYASERSKPLRICGPPETESKLARATELFYPGLEETGFPLELSDLPPGAVVEEDPLRVSAFEVDHFSGGTALGYRVSAGDRTVVYSGDTGWTEALSRESDGADLFICECSGFDRPLERHLTYRELEAHASELRAERMLLVHAGDEVLAHRRELAHEIADDGMEVTL